MEQGDTGANMRSSPSSQPSSSARTRLPSFNAQFGIEQGPESYEEDEAYRAHFTRAQSREPGSNVASSSRQHTEFQPPFVSAPYGTAAGVASAIAHSSAHSAYGRRGSLSHSQPASPSPSLQPVYVSPAAAASASRPSSSQNEYARYGRSLSTHDQQLQRGWTSDVPSLPAPQCRGRSHTLQSSSLRPWTGPEAVAERPPMVREGSARNEAPEVWPPLLQSHPLLRADGEPRTYTLSFRQQPQHGRMFGFRNKDRRPLDPLPIVQLVLRDRNGEIDHMAHTSPDLLMRVALISDVWGRDELVSSSSNPSTALPRSRLLEGKLTSSGHNVKDPAGDRVCLFLFPDLSVRVEATVRLHFTLIRLGWQAGADQQIAGRVVAEITSDPFPIHSARNFPGLAESTELAKCLAAQGVAVPIRNQTRPGPTGE